jgi:hypothetical protein
MTPSKMTVSIDVAFAGSMDGVLIELFEMTDLLTEGQQHPYGLEETDTGVILAGNHSGVP